MLSSVFHHSHTPHIVSPSVSMCLCVFTNRIKWFDDHDDDDDGDSNEKWHSGAFFDSTYDHILEKIYIHVWFFFFTFFWLLLFFLFTQSTRAILFGLKLPIRFSLYFFFHYTHHKQHYHECQSNWFFRHWSV